MIRLALPLVALLLAAPSVAAPSVAAPSVAASSSAPPDEEAVRALASEWVATWNAHDAEGLLALYADGALMAWPQGLEAAVTDRAAVLAGSRRFHEMAARNEFRLDVEITHVAVHEEAAVVFLRGYRHQAEGDPLPLHSQLTLVRQDGAWRVAAEHTMVVADV